MNRLETDLKTGVTSVVPLTRAELDTLPVRKMEDDRLKAEVATAEQRREALERLIDAELAKNGNITGQ